MEEDQRKLLQRSRVKLVKKLQVDPLWDLLLSKGIFTQDMIEEIQTAGSRRDQARQLVTDLQTRGSQAFPAFVSCLQETGQNELADLLSQGCDRTRPPPAAIKPVPVPLRGGQSHLRRTAAGVPAPLVPTVNQRCPTSAGATTPLQGSLERKSRRDPEMDYILKTKPCGYCLIVNNVNFSVASGLARRVGSDVDCQRLEKRFKSLHFEVFTQKDLEAREIVQELQSLAKRDHTSFDCCLVVLLSHGCQASHFQFPGGIYGSDGVPIPVERIVTYFNGSNCPSLRGKPKLFFIQACGGEQKDRGCEVDLVPSDRSSVESDSVPFQAPAGNLDEPDAVASLPTASDILVSYSTFPGFVSWRDTKVGSWYVETLDDVLQQYASSEDLSRILLRVANTVSAKGKYKQMPGCFNFLRKRFFFMAE
uniref:Caspase-9 n=1 Tax=Salvator merianae TaxID=96440 RepID=A0A8D0BUE6_SALMN